MASIMQQYNESRKPEPDKRSYTMVEVEKGLNALLAFGGSPVAAHRALKEAYGIDIPPERLRAWRESTHAEAYTALQEKHGPAIEEAMIREVRDMARAAAHAERLAVEKVMIEMSKDNSRFDPAQVAVAMSKVKASNVEKMLTLTGRPAQITEHRSPTELLRALEAKGVLKRAEEG